MATSPDPQLPPGDEGSYPDDDLKALLVGGMWKFVHKDGSAY